MTFSIVEPPQSVRQFIAQTYDDAEYLRKHKPNGSLYDTVDALGYRGHCAYDLNDVFGDRTMEASFDARYTQRHDSALGNVGILTAGDGSGLWYCHLARHLSGHGATVRAGQPIAVMGETGYATGVHCHLIGLHHTDDYGSIFNYGQQLRDLKDRLLHGGDDPMAKTLLYRKQGYNGIYVLNGDYMTPIPSRLILDSARIDPEKDVIVLPADNSLWGLPVLRAGDIDNP